MLSVYVDRWPPPPPSSLLGFTLWPPFPSMFTPSLAAYSTLPCDPLPQHVHPSLTAYSALPCDPLPQHVHPFSSSLLGFTLWPPSPACSPWILIPGNGTQGGTVRFPSSTEECIQLCEDDPTCVAVDVGMETPVLCFTHTNETFANPRYENPFLVQHIKTDCSAGTRGFYSYRERRQKTLKENIKYNRKQRNAKLFRIWICIHIIQAFCNP